VATVLAGLSSARTPWLTLALAGPVDHGRLAATAADPDVIPAFRQFKLATEDAARDLGYDTGMRAAVRGFLEARLDALWAGPAGLFLEGGHPAGLARLLRGNVLVTGGGLADEEARTFLAGRPVPGMPGPLRSAGQLRAGGQALSLRGRECLLATVIDAAIAARAPALRTSYDPRYLAAVTATVAGRMLGDSAGAPARAGGLAPAGAPARAGVPARAGAVWVIPQLRWLHEMERLTPFGRDRLRPGDIAPPLDFGLAGLPDWPGRLIGPVDAGPGGPRRPGSGRGQDRDRIASGRDEH
jgi:hypothetical protein